MLRIAWNCHQKILGQQKLPHLFSKSAPNMIAYFAWASGPLQCLSNQSISANNKTVKQYCWLDKSFSGKVGRTKPTAIW